MKLGLFGGSFDPVHDGHLAPVRAAIERLGLERVDYLPTGQPPHKSPRRAPAWRRFAMVELAVLGQPRCRVSAFELVPERVAYTVETIRHYRRRFPDAQLHLLLGADSYRELPRWREWQEIVDSAVLVVLARPGEGEAPAPPALAASREAGRTHLVENPPVPFSSRELREHLASGAPLPPDALPPLVLDYIRKYGLYR